MSKDSDQSSSFRAISTIDSGQSTLAILPISHHAVITNPALPSAASYESSNVQHANNGGLANLNYEKAVADISPNGLAANYENSASMSLDNPEHSLKPGTQYSTFEEILEDVGPFGRYQQLFVFLIQFVVLAYCGNYVFMTYAIVEPNYKCEYLLNNYTFIELNGTNDNGPVFPTPRAISNLEMTSNLTTCDILEKCSQDNITTTRDFFGIVEEWGLQCHLDYLPSLILTLERAGSLFGSPIGGYLSDHCGRKMVFLTSHCLTIMFSFSCVLTQGWLGFAIVRTFIGFLMAVSQVSFFTWTMEQTNSNHNLILNLAGNWQFIYMLSALIGYLTGSWRRYLICINSLAVLVIPAFMLYGESPRWLIQQKRTVEAARSINIMQRWNKKKKDAPIVLIQATSLHSIPMDLNKRHYTFLHLFHTRELAIYTSVLSLLTFTAALVANTFLFNIGHMAGNPFLDIFIYGALRSWIPFTVWAADRRFKLFGRKTLFYIGISTILGCLVLVVFLFHVESTPGSNLTAITGFGVFAAAMCAPLWTCLGQYQVELYPTVIRNIAIGFTVISGEVGGLVAPQIIYLENSMESLPYIVNAVIVFVTLVAGAIFLPETKGRDMPDQLQSTVALPDSIPKRLRVHRKREDVRSLVDDDQLASSNTADFVTGGR